MKFKFIIIFLLSFLLFSCTSNKKKDESKNNELIKNLNASVMYSVALDHLYEDDTISSTEMFKNIIKNYPYADEAIESSIMLIWVNYQENNFVDAEVEIDSFIRNYPTSKYIKWVKYIQGLIFYEQMGEVTRQQASAQEALLIFKELLARYSDSKYSKDIELRIEIIRDHIAGKEMEIGVYYQKNEEYISSIGRFNTIVKDFNDSVFIEEALYRLVSSYISLGILEEAYYNAVLLGYNYPSSIWYEKSYNLLQKTGKLEELKSKFSTLQTKK